MNDIMVFKTCIDVYNIIINYILINTIKHLNVFF